MKGRRPGTPEIFGLLAEFASPKDVVSAAHRVRKAGYLKVDAYSPYPMEELTEALELPHSRLPLIVLVGGLCGALAGYGLQYWSSVIAYPMNIGGRPFHSWVSFIPPTFETTILFAAGSAVLGMLALNGLPQPYHPVFNVPSFAMATRDRFFLCIEATDPKFEKTETRRFLEALSPLCVSEVDH